MDARSGRPPLGSEVVAEFWSGVRRGHTIESAAAAAGVSMKTAHRWFRQRGGVMPPAEAGRRSRSLTFAEREEIALLKAADMGVRAIARAIGRDPSTVSRELRRVKHNVTPSDRHRYPYRASTAQADADQRARRPKEAKLSTNLRLRREVQDRLGEDHSPEQTAQRLRQDFPDDPEMWVSHETIYQSLYVQSRGGLKRELTRHLRTGRAVRKPYRQPGQRRERFAGMVMISERPAEVEDRAVPGHWESQCFCQAA